MIYDFIFDLDGTLTNNDHRQHFLEQAQKDWKSFNECCVHDLPNHEVIDTFNSLVAARCNILILTGRSVKFEKETIEWLRKYQVDIDNDQVEIIMRPLNDNSPDYIFKTNVYNSFSMAQKEFLVAAFDDRSRVVRMWRELGVPCFQVAKGDY